MRKTIVYETLSQRIQNVACICESNPWDMAWRATPQGHKMDCQKPFGVGFCLFCFAFVHSLYFVVTIANRNLKIWKQKYKPQTKSFRSTFRMLCPANHSGCAQLTFTEWWKLLSTSHWSSHFKWQSQSKLLVFRTLQKENKEKNLSF